MGGGRGIAVAEGGLGSPRVRELLDTHIWVWFVTEDRKLTTSIRRSIERAPDRFAVSPISHWEVLMLARRGRFEPEVNSAEWIRRARAPFAEAPVTAAVTDAMHGLAIDGFDPGDAFLAATAKAYDLTLVTVDERLLTLEGISARDR